MECAIGDRFQFRKKNEGVELYKRASDERPIYAIPAHYYVKKDPHLRNSESNNIIIISSRLVFIITGIIRSFEGVKITAENIETGLLATFLIRSRVFQGEEFIGILKV